MTAGPAASRRVLARTPVAPLPASSPTRPVGINGRTSAPPDSSLPDVCSCQLPKVCSFRLPLTKPPCEHLEGTLAHVTLEEVDRGGSYAYANLSRLRPRLFGISPLEHVGPAEAAIHHSLHFLRPCPVTSTGTSSHRSLPACVHATPPRGLDRTPAWRRRVAHSTSSHTV